MFEGWTIEKNEHPVRRGRGGTTVSKDYGKVLNEYKNKAGDYFSDPEKLSDLLSDAKKKAFKNNGPLDEIWNKLQLMFGMIKDWSKGNYKDVPKSSIVAIIAGLIYFVSSVDLIPDVLPAIGIADDIIVLGLIIKQVSSDLDKYREWREHNEEMHE